MADSRSKNSQRNLIWAMVNKFAILLVQFFSRTVFIYTLGELYLGLNGLFASTLDFLVLAELGVGSAMVFSMYKPMAENDTATVCALLNLYRKVYRIIGTVMLIGGTILMFFLPYLIKGEIPDDVNLYVLYALNLSKTVVSYFLFAYKGSILTANQRSDISSRVGIILGILSNLCQILVLVLFRSYYFYCCVLIAFTIISNLVINHVINKKYPQYKCYGTIDKDLLSDIKKRIAGLFVWRICYVFRDAIDAVFISAFIGLSILGKYNNYMFIINTLTGLLVLARSSITASIGNSIATESEEKNYADFNKCQLLYMWTSIWCTVCLYCMFQPFLKVWVGTNYLLGEIELFMFCLYFLCHKLGDICSTYRQAAGLWWQDRYRPVAEAIVKTALNFIVIKHFGVNGALGGTVFCLVFINSIWASWVLYRYYFKHQSQWDYIKKNLFYLVFAIILCLVTSFLCSLLPGEGIFNLVLRAVLCLIIPNLIMWAVFRHLKEYSESMGMLKRLIMARH